MKDGTLTIVRGPLRNTDSPAVIGLAATYDSWNLDALSSDWGARPGIKRAWRRTGWDPTDVECGSFTAHFGNTTETLILIQKLGAGLAQVYSVNTETGATLAEFNVAGWNNRSATRWQFCKREGYIHAINSIDGEWRKKIGDNSQGAWQQVETRLFAPGVLSSDVRLTRPAPDYPVHFLDNTNHTYETFSSPKNWDTGGPGWARYAAGVFQNQSVRIDLVAGGIRNLSKHPWYVGCNVKFEIGATYGAAPPVNTGVAGATADLPGSSADTGGINMENQRYVTFEVELEWDFPSGSHPPQFDPSKPCYCFVSQFPSTLRNGWGPCNPPYTIVGPPSYMDHAPTEAWKFYPGDATAHADITKGWINARAYMSVLEFWGQGNFSGDADLPKRVLITIDLEQTWFWNGTTTKPTSTLKNVRQLCFFFPVYGEYGINSVPATHAINISSPKFGGVWQNKGYYTDQLTFYDSDRPNLVAPKDIEYALTTEIAGTDNSPVFFRVQAPYGVGAIPSGGTFPLGAIHTLDIPDGTVNPVCLYRKRNSFGNRWYRIFRNTGVATTFEDHLSDVVTDVVGWGQLAYARTGYGDFRDDTIPDPFAPGNPVGGIVAADYNFGAGVRQDLLGKTIATWRGSIVIGGVTTYPSKVFISDRVYENNFLFPPETYRGGVVQGTDDPFAGNTVPVSSDLGDSAENIYGEDTLYIVTDRGVYAAIGVLPSDIDIPRKLSGSLGQLNPGASYPWQGGVLVATLRGLYWYTFRRGFSGELEGAYPPGDLLTKDVDGSWNDLLSKTGTVRVFVIHNEIVVTKGSFFLHRSADGEWVPGAFDFSGTGDSTVAGPYTFAAIEPCSAALSGANRVEDRVNVPSPSNGIAMMSGIFSPHLVTTNGELHWLWRDPVTGIPYKSDNGVAITWAAQPGDLITHDPNTATNTAAVIVDGTGVVRLAAQITSGAATDHTAHNDWVDRKVNQGLRLPYGSRARFRIGGANSGVRVPVIYVSRTEAKGSLNR